jgi:hypothetical protein
MKDITIIAGISKFDPIYSIANVVRSQCKYFIQKGYNVKLIVWSNFDSSSLPVYLKNIEIVKILSPPEFDKPWELGDKLETEIQKISNLLSPEISSCDVCIAHDFLLLHCYVPFNIAFRKLSSIGNSPVWLHWNHSRPIYEVFDSTVLAYINEHELINSYIVYPNSTDMEYVCKFYSIPQDHFMTIHNNLDLDIYLDLPESVLRILSKYKPHHDFISLYPTRLNIHKNIDKLILLAGFLVKNSVKPLFIIANSYNFGRAYGLKEYYTALIAAQDLEEYFLFTSDLGYIHGLQNSAVQKLFQFSSFFIFPTKAEAMPLVLLEAAVGSNILIVNDNVNSLKEVCGNEAYYIDFSSSKSEWMNNCYNIIKTELDSNKQVRMKHRILNKFTTHSVYSEMFENKIKAILNLSDC